MKKVIVLLSLITLHSCAQNGKKKMNTEKITASNFVEEVAKHIKKYDEEPIYYLRISKSNCLIEILINDIPVYESYELANLATGVKINHTILKSGTQKVTYKLYPVGNLIKDEYDFGDTITKLGDATSARIGVSVLDKNSQNGLEDEEVVHTYITPTKVDNEDVFIGSGQAYYENSFTFEATVPYEITGWKDGADLRKLPKDKLENAMLRFYKKQLKIYEDKNEDALAQMEFIPSIINTIVFYKNREDIEGIWKTSIETIRAYKEMKPIKDYELIFYGNGKLAFLRHKTIEDAFYRNTCAAWFGYENKEGNGRARFLALYLKVPKDSLNVNNLKFVIN